jgi:hypothetical protein
MTDSKNLHLFRRVLGLVLFGFGLTWLWSETQSVMNHEPFHPWHIIIAGLLMFAGGYLMNPPDAEAIADAVLKRVPLVAGLWPGGMRKTDPPPDPAIPPPPSVTGESEER